MIPVFAPALFMPQPAASSTTLDPAKTNTANGAALSGGNLIFTGVATGVGAPDQFAYSLSINGHSSGKFYAEITNTAGAPGVYDTGFGFALGATYTDLTGIGNSGTDNAGFWVESGDANFYQNGNVGTSLGVSNTTIGAVTGMAVDLTNQRIWYRINGGNWNGNPANNPSTNIGGVDISPSLSGSPTVYAAAIVGTRRNGSTTPILTINLGGSSYANAAPAGFVNW